MSRTRRREAGSEIDGRPAWPVSISRLNRWGSRIFASDLGNVRRSLIDTRAEEVYLILGGTGRVKLDDEIAEVRRLDAIRIAPEVVRAFEAGPRWS
jgi:hypothetical protein